MSTMSFLGKMAGAGLGLFYPSRCAACSGPVGYDSHNLCDACLSKIMPVELQCQRCGYFLVDGACSRCSRRIWYCDRSIAVTEYNEVMRSVMHAVKFQNCAHAYRRLLPLIVEVCGRFGVPIDCVTAVPMNRRKLLTRGYNQTELIARDCSRALSIPFVPLLRERAAGGTQRTLGYVDRFINVIDRYDLVRGKKIEQQSILLMDDICTTGATLNECARILKGRGAAHVYSVIIARAHEAR